MVSNLIDLTFANSPAAVIEAVKEYVEKNDVSYKNIILDLGDILLAPSHFSSIKDILEDSQASIEMVYTPAVHTQIAALSAGLSVSEGNAPKEEPSKDIEQTLEEAIDKEKELDFESLEDQDVKTLYLKQTLRSGQSINYDGNVVIIGDCNPGSEIKATGDITVWGIISGIAQAGIEHNHNASIRALKINAIQLRIADMIARRPDRDNKEKIEKSNMFTPEEAKIENGEIVINTLNM